MKKLDEAGELDCHLKPKTNDDIDSDDEDEEFSGTGDGVRVGEGTRHKYYLNQVLNLCCKKKKCWCDNIVFIDGSISGRLLSCCYWKLPLHVLHF